MDQQPGPYAQDVRVDFIRQDEMTECFFCGLTERPLTEEHAWPKTGSPGGGLSGSEGAPDLIDSPGIRH